MEVTAIVSSRHLHAMTLVKTLTLTHTVHGDVR